MKMSDNVENRLSQNLIPFVALIGYKGEENCEDDSYFECHEIDKDGVMRAGVPLSIDCISEVASSFSVEQSIVPHGVVPSNMMFFDNRVGHERYIWYNPPRKRMMFFKDDLCIENGEYFVPGVIYEVNGKGNLNIYAFKGNKPSKVLFCAPFFNVSNGSVCLGNAKLDYPDSPSFYDYMDYWEKKFWLSEFSHLGTNSVKGNLVLVTKNSKEKKFDVDVLLPMNITLQDLLG